MRTRFETLSLLIVLLLGAWIALVGCAHCESFEPTPVSEIPDGPGLFTGATGKWMVLPNGAFLPKEEAAESKPKTGLPSNTTSPTAPPPLPMVPGKRPPI